MAKSRIFNCNPSRNRENDWTMADAFPGKAKSISSPPASKDLRENWWAVRDQKDTGACVGFAAADGVLRWHYVKAGWIKTSELPSPRFIWMANKETDEITDYPTTFLEEEGTQVKLALRVARNYGCVFEEDLPMSGGLSKLTRAAFYSKAAKLRIASYHGLSSNLDEWKFWIANIGPVLSRLDVDDTWMNATRTRGKLDQYNPGKVYGGHAICIVGYTPDSFIIRNSWGEKWGEKGFAYASIEYVRQAITEAYGVTL